MIEIRITGYTLQECIDQISGYGPTKPVEEVKPVETQKPVEPEKPVEEKKPEETQKPVEAEKPVEKPVETQKSVEKPVEEKKPVEKPIEKPAEEKEPEVTREMCFKIATEVKNKISTGALRVILSELNASKFTEVDPSNYPALYKACVERLKKADEGK